MCVCVLKWQWGATVGKCSPAAVLCQGITVCDICSEGNEEDTEKDKGHPVHRIRENPYRHDNTDIDVTVYDRFNSKTNKNILFDVKDNI